jgi:hypothetical protein
LTLSGPAADQLLFIASQLSVRMPLVASALTAGRLDGHKVWIFVDYLASATDEQVAVICGRLVPQAAGWTSTQLRARLKRALLEIDPGWRHRRYREAVTGRHLSRYLNDDGSATISGVGVPLAEAMAACARVEALASAARAAGHPCTIGQLQLDVFVGLISGQWQHCTDEQILTALLERGTRPEDNPAEPAEPAGLPEPAEPTGSPEPAEPVGSPEPAEPVGSPEPAEPVGPPEPAEPAGSTQRGSRATPPVRHGGWEMQVGLSTLFGLDERVGVVTGWGAVPALVARDIVGQRWRGQWRFVVLDSTGRMEFAGITRRRPHRHSEATDPAGVELHLTAAELRELVTSPGVAREWVPIIEDISTQYERFRGNPRAWFSRLWTTPPCQNPRLVDRHSTPQRPVHLDQPPRTHLRHPRRTRPIRPHPHHRTHHPDPRPF